MNRDQFVEHLKSLIVESGGQSAFARNAGISRQYLSDILRKRREPGAIVANAVGYQKRFKYLLGDRIMDYRQLISHLKAQSQSAGGQSAFARAVGISRQRLSDVLRKRRKPSRGFVNALGGMRETDYVKQSPSSFANER